MFGTSYNGVQVIANEMARPAGALFDWESGDIANLVIENAYAVVYQ